MTFDGFRSSPLLLALSVLFLLARSGTFLQLGADYLRETLADIVIDHSYGWSFITEVPTI